MLSCHHTVSATATLRYFLHLRRMPGIPRSRMEILKPVDCGDRSGRLPSATGKVASTLYISGTVACPRYTFCASHGLKRAKNHESVFRCPILSRSGASLTSQASCLCPECRTGHAYGHSGGRMSDSNCVRIGQGSTTPAAHPYRIGKSVCFSQVQWCLTLSGNTNDGPRVKRTPLSSGGYSYLHSAFTQDLPCIHLG